MHEPEMTVNVPLLRKSLEHITAHPEEWRQNVWVEETDCGTVACLAGTALALQGHEFEFQYKHVWSELFPNEAFGLVDGRGIADVAAEELGLTYKQSTVLFGGGNSLSHLWHLANIYTNGEIEVPEQFL